MHNAATIRISERDSNCFELVIIRKEERRTYNQGPAIGAKTPAEAYAYAQRTLPAAVLVGAAWEYRSVDGVYADLDIAKLGWR